MTPAEIHARFKALPGSDQIASEFAIGEIMNAVRKKRPKRILEIGSGIGTLTFALLDSMEEPAELFCIEENAWCRDMVRKNLPTSWNRLVSVIDPLATSPPWRGFFDFIVVDGERLATSGCADHCVVIIEGNRRRWRERLEFYLASDLSCTDGLIGRSWARLHLKPADRSKGVWIYQIDATSLEQIAFRVRQLWQDVLDLVWRMRCWIRGIEPRLGKKRNAG